MRLRLAPTRSQSAAGFDVVLRFTAVRREHKVALDAASLQNVLRLGVSRSKPATLLEPTNSFRSTAPSPSLREHTAG